MTQTSEATPVVEAPAEASTRKKSGGLSSMLLPELKQLAGSLGVKATTGMRKSALVEAISAAQSGGGAPQSGRSNAPSDSPNGQSSSGATGSPATTSRDTRGHDSNRDDKA
ncbi:MAG: Rho termination factor N-terminal domain-containing protein, partial [Actinomycetota bacterium]|nr:Rho termination factor N-terminal domain-containing protein [Actinomycetota bacterium]